MTAAIRRAVMAAANATSGGGGEWSPLDLSGLLLFLDPTPANVRVASDGSGSEPSANDPIGHLEDLSGNDWHFSQSTTSGKAILKQDANGKYYLDADGVDDYYDAPGVLPSDWTTSGLIVAAAWKDNVPGAGEPNDTCLFSDEESNFVGVRLYGHLEGTQDDTPEAGLIADSLSVYARTSFSSNEWDLGPLVTIGGYSPGASFWLNTWDSDQKEAAADTTWSDPISVSTGDNASIFKPAHRTTTATLFKGQLYALVVVKADTPIDDLIQLRDWLAARAGTVVTGDPVK